MWNCKVALIFVVLGGIVHCEEAKVEEISKENSTITYIRHTGNGGFASPPENSTFPIPVTTHRVYQDPHMFSQCGGIFRNLQNLIESPKFISPRPVCNLRCEYQIVSPYICENEFHVQFLDFAIDSSQNCENDRVIINYNDVLCGNIIGVKKFRTKGGVLNITFTSRSWDLKQGRGFRMLVTRLPCVEDSSENQTEVDSLEPEAPKEEEEEPRCFHVNSSYAVANPSYPQGHPIYGVPSRYNRTFNGRQDIPVIPLPQPGFPTYPPPDLQPSPFPPQNFGPDIPPTPLPPPIFPPGGILPPQFLPQCCRNNYSQQRFLLLSQGFPAHFMRQNDCIFVIQRSSPNVCKLRIIFKYFLLDDPQAGQFGCLNNFIEIDGQRICGCKTNFIYETLWGYEPKVIRMRNVAGTFANPQGFIFDVIQEACPFKIQENITPYQRDKRFLLTKTLLLNSLLNRENQVHPQAEIIPAITQIKNDIDEKFKSKFFQSDTNFVNNVCVLNHLKLFQLKMETLGVPKQYCIASF